MHLCTALTTYPEEGVAEFRSCKFTKSDEEFSMVCFASYLPHFAFGIISSLLTTYRPFFLLQIRLQMFCLLLGSMAAMRIRKEKRVSASLFDQRSQGGADKPPDPRKRRNSDGIRPHVIEQEMTPLVSTNGNPLEVV
eukprot:Plantae.Rhodophyta-Palmaria_palmata.ctg27723.p1 GENE.Plantae.Rhodophyta-Palmaria_palmata.ctg27723~~Plantae.Rhodophyta-Palmaria_palmata.ctg27723.p1  ORF type:complete len:137 (-),score=11.69 Plantae.Rhodophyta-Palmaria_palmata.ctg27723:337-747(-)